MVKLEHSVAIVGEECGVCGVAVCVISLSHLHHRVLLVLKPCTHRKKSQPLVNTCTNFLIRKNLFREDFLKKGPQP